MPTLEWIGKEKVINYHQKVPYRVLERKYSFDEKGQHTKDNGSENMIIHGDNLEALKALLPRYEGRINCIYIDPPYNTGNENWVYNDNVNDPKMRKWLGQAVGKEGEDLSRHDKWLCMMYPRLKLLQKLLADDGAIFISIDDNEQANLKLICDEIFGANNFVAQTVWDLGTGTQAGYFTRAHEYILVYFKCKGRVKNFSGGNGTIEHSALKKISYKNPASNFEFPAGTRWDAQNGQELKQSWGNSEKTTLVSGKMVCDNGTLKYPVVLSAGWAMKDQMSSWFNGKQTYDSKGQHVNEFYFNAKGVLRYVKERSVVNPPSVLRNIANTKNGSDLLNNILGPNEMPFPKPIELIEYLLTLMSNKDSIILDSFAGSGTTAHAMLNMNKEDNGHRKFILIEMMDYAETMTAERVRRVIHGYDNGKTVVEGTGGSFSYYELGEPLFLKNYILNEKIPTEKIREYVYFMETRQPIEKANPEEPYLLGQNNGTAYYFYYEKQRVTSLNHAFLNTLKTKAENRIIYADCCYLSEQELNQHNITFKKIPRDISRL
jgi:adenine-specific DNA-methyltransferase